MSVDINSIKRDLLNSYPFFGSIIDSLDYIETRNCYDMNGNPTAGTNGNTIYYHPDFISSLNDSQKKFVFAHEVCHIAFNHIERGKNKVQEVWNIATDAIINAFLKKDGLEFVGGVIDIPWAIKYDAEEMYEKLLKKKNRKDKRKNKKQNQQQSQSSFNESNKQEPKEKHLTNKDIGHATHSLWDEKSLDKPKDKIIKEVQKKFAEMGEKKVLKAKKSSEIKEILEKIKDVLKKINKVECHEEENTMGIAISIGGKKAGIGTLEESVKFEDVGEAYPLINWPLILKRPTEIVELDWSYKNAYLEDGIVTANLEECSYLLTHETEIVLDTSGSIDDDMLRSFLRECKNILNFSKIKVGCFDTKFYGFTEINNIREVDDFTFVGRGGTDFAVAVNAFSKNVDNKIIFTDGNADMPNINSDAIWIVFGATKIKPKGGKVIYIDKSKLVKLSQNYNSMVLTRTKEGRNI